MIALADTDVARIALGDTDILTVSLGRKVLFSFDPMTPLLATVGLWLDADDPNSLSDSLEFNNKGSYAVNETFFNPNGTFTTRPNGRRVWVPNDSSSSRIGFDWGGFGTIVFATQINPDLDYSALDVSSDSFSTARLDYVYYPTSLGAYVIVREEASTKFIQTNNSWDPANPMVGAVRLKDEATDTFQMWTNEVGPSSGTFTGPVYDFGTPGTRLEFGYELGVYEILMWDEELSDAEVLATMSYLNDKWGLGYSIGGA